MKCIIVRRRFLSLVLCAALAVSMIVLVNHPAFVGASATTRQLPIYCVQKDYKVCALSFDAAWGNEETQKLIDLLDKYKIKATFFAVGDWVDRYPDSVKALSGAGHEVMNHSDNHAHFNSLSTSQIMQDINSCNQKIEAITGVHPTLFRPPYGEYNDLVVSTVRSMGMEVIHWDVDSFDWKNIPPDEISKRVTERVQPGSIVLFHNEAKNTADSLPSIIETLVQDGYTFVPVSELILLGSYVMDHSGKQCPVSSPQ